MDQSTITDQAINSLSHYDKIELQKVINAEEQKMRIHSNVLSMTDMCWKKCITGPIKQGALDNTEAGCMANCVDRFMDTNNLTLQLLQNKRR